jgi:hypothetical protein
MRLHVMYTLKFQIMELLRYYCAFYATHLKKNTQLGYFWG